MIKDIILETLEEIPGIQTILYENAFSANVVLDRKPCPAAILYTITDYTFDISKGIYKESTEASIFFCDIMPQVNSFSNDTEPIIERMLAIAKDFLRVLLEKLKENNMYLENNTLELRTTFGKFDKHVCGVSISNLQIKNRQGSCL